MSKSPMVICYSNVMRLWRHTNILLQLKQKYWESQGKRGSQFQSERQFKFPRNCLTHAALTNCLTVFTDKCVKMKNNNNNWLRDPNVERHLIDRLFSIEAFFHGGNSFIIERGNLKEKLEKEKNL